MTGVFKSCSEKFPWTSIRSYTDRIPWIALRNLFGVIVLINFVGKLVGFAREMVIANAFGTSIITNTYGSIQILPAAIGAFATGAFGLAFVPYYASNIKAGRGRQVAVRSTIGAVVVGFILAILFTLGGKPIIHKLLNIQRPQELSLAYKYNPIMALSVPAMILVGLAFATLVAERRNVAALLLTGVSQVFMISCLYLQLKLNPENHLALPISYTVGFGLTSIIALWIMIEVIRRPDDHVIIEEVDSKTLGLRSFVKQLGATTAENVAASLNQMLNINFANAIGPGSVAINGYASKIGMMALYGIISPFNQVVQGRLARAKISDARRSFLLVFAPYLFGVLLVSVVTILLRVQLVRLVYQRGEFTARDTFHVAAVIVPWAFYLFVMSLNQILARYYFVIARGTYYTVCLVSAYAFSNILKWWMHGRYGLTGIIWACVVGEGLAGLFLALQVLFQRGVRGET